MTILDKIIAQKRIEVEASKTKTSIEMLRELPFYKRTPYRLKDFLFSSEKTGIIAEYKRASPSKGLINGTSTVQEVVKGYQDAGASAVSVLTDSEFFKGNLDDLIIAREALEIPILRKEFIVDTFQIEEAKAYGADVILLIAACLSAEEIKEFSEYAQRLGLSVLLEVHNKEELDRSIFPSIDAIGVNNRNLKDFSVSLEHSYELVKQIPDSYAKVSESGISDPETIKQLKSAGFNGFLIGENFMKTSDPATAIVAFVNQL